MNRLPVGAAAVAALLATAMPAVVDAQGWQRDGFGGGGFGRERMGEKSPRAGGGGLNPQIMGAFSPVRANRAAMEKRGFIATGLKAVYPAEADCLPIVSPFASRTRYDGSRRSFRFFEGRHGGADISADGGTPLLAIVDGTVVYKHEGPNIGGISIFLQHSPEDTGLPVWL